MTCNDPAIVVQWALSRLEEVKQQRDEALAHLQMLTLELQRVRSGGVEDVRVVWDNTPPGVAPVTRDEFGLCGGNVVQEDAR